MPTQRASKSEQLTEALHQALRGNEPLTQEIRRLFLFRKHGQAVDTETGNTGFAFIRFCLSEFRTQNPGQAELLSKRFVEKESTKSIANRLSLSQEQVNRQQKAAIEALAEWVLIEEERQEKEFERSLINSLVSPSYTQLFGAEKITSLLTDLLGSSKSPWLISLIGLGGIGKTALADWTLRALIPNFPYQQLFWLRADREKGRPVRKEQLVGQLCRRFIADAIPFAGQLSELRKYLKAHSCLIVLDDLDTELADLELVELLQDLASPSKFLLTSRRLPAPLAQVYIVPVTELKPNPALELLVYEASQRGMQNVARDMRAHMEEIYARTGGNPLALRLVAGLLQAWSLPTVLAALQKRTGGDIEKMYASIFEQSWQALSRSGQRLLLSMLLVGTEGATEQHLQAVSGLEEVNLRTVSFELRQRSLLEIRGSILEPRYGIHHLTETFLRNFRQPFADSGRANLVYWGNQLQSQQRNQILKAERGNLERAVEFGFEIEAAQLTCELLNDLFPAILELGAAREWVQHFKRAPEWKTGAEKRASLLYQLGALYWQLGETENALKAFSQCVELAQQHNLGRQHAAAQLGICLSYWSATDYERAGHEAQIAEQVLHSIDESDSLQVRGLAILGIVAFAIEDYTEAVSLFNKAIERLPAGEKSIRAQLELDLGLSLQAKGEIEDASKKYNTAAALLKSVPYSEKYLATVEILRASLHYQDRKMDAAKAALERAARLLQIDKDELEITALLEGQLGRVHFKVGETEKALSFLGSAAKLWGQLGNSWMMIDTHEALDEIVGK